MSIHDALKAWNARVAGQPQHEFAPGPSISDAELASAETSLGEPLPPSFRELVAAYGAFSIGTPGAGFDQTVFRVWPPTEYRSALAIYADQLECEATAAAISGEIGVDEDAVGALARVIVVGCHGHEDYCGFDLRTRNATTGECRFGITLFEDNEICALAERAAVPFAARGFDAYLERNLSDRSPE